MNAKDKRHRFQPEVESKLKRPTSVSNRPPGEYMKPTVNYEIKTGEEKVQLQKTKRALLDKDRQFKEECSFKPNINKAFQQQKEESKEDRWKKLTQPKTAVQQQRDRVRQQEEQSEFQKVCTFQPSVGRPPAREGKENVNSIQRLTHEADRRREKREKLKRELDNEQLKACSFQP